MNSVIMKREYAYMMRKKILSFISSSVRRNRGWVYVGFRE